MKKWISIVLMAWLPCFMVAAHAMGMQMAFESASPVQLNAAEQSKMTCHEHLNHHQANDIKAEPNASHHCSFCAFCVVGSAIAATPTLKFSHIQLSNIQPTSFEVAFTSQDYPPAIKPPIFN